MLQKQGEIRFSDLGKAFDVNVPAGGGMCFELLPRSKLLEAVLARHRVHS